MSPPLGGVSVGSPEVRAVCAISAEGRGWMCIVQCRERSVWTDMADSPRELTQNPLKKIWVPYNNGCPVQHSAQRRGNVIDEIDGCMSPGDVMSHGPITGGREFRKCQCTGHSDV